MKQTISKFASVPALSSVVYDFVVPDGETWDVARFEGSGAYLSDAEAMLVWDPSGANEIVAATHGDADLALDFRVVGGGGKVLRIVLDNATTLAHTLGVVYEINKAEQ